MVLVFVIIVIFNPFGQQTALKPAVTGERDSGFSSFYYAEEGTWRLLDPVTHVLKEQKYTSSDSEKDAFTLKEVPSGGIVTITASEGRWKKVEVIENGKPVVSGWIDAHFVQNAEHAEQHGIQRET